MPDLSGEADYWETTMRTMMTVLLVCVVLASTSAAAWAADAEAPAATPPAGEASAKPEAPAFEMPRSLALLGACLGAALAAVGGGYCIARIGMSCIEATARQPEAGGQMFAPMIITAAMVEGATLFAVVVCMLSLF